MANDEWTKFFPNKKENKTISAARDSELAQRQLWNKISHNLPEDQTKKVNAVVEEYEHEDSMSALEHLVEELLADFEEGKDSFERKRSHGGRKISRGTQTFINSFSEFLTCYSDVVNIVKSADSQFGGVAVQALSVFLIVAVNKQRKEDLIDSSLATMKSQFPRLKGLSIIYPTEKMQELIVSVYKDVIEFAEEAVKYYKRSTWVRVWSAIKSPPQIKLQRKVNKILEELSEVKEETNFLLNQRVQRLENDLADVNKTVKGVQRQVDQAAKQKEQELFNSFEDALLPEGYSKSEHLQTCKEQLQHRFTRRKFSLLTLSDLEKYSCYKMWYESTIAQTLVIRGSTLSGPKTPLSWLSNVSVELVDKLQSENKAVAYYFCRLEAHGTSQKLEMAEVLCKLIHQLFESRPDILQDGELEQNYLAPIRNRKWDKKRAYEFFVEVVRKIGTVYLVVDRPEECKGGIRVLSQLFERAKEARCILKTIIVLDKEQTDSDEVIDLQDAEGFCSINDLDQR